jgi:hypothetical protein
LGNSILRETVGIPLTRRQRAEIKKQTPKLKPREVDKNIYRSPLSRQRSPKETKNRRRPGWTTCGFTLPRVTLEGLRLLAKTMAARELQARAFAELGYRRRYPRTRSYYLLLGLNWLFRECDIAEFCVEEASPEPGRVRRFMAPAD